MDLSGGTVAPIDRVSLGEGTARSTAASKNNTSRLPVSSGIAFRQHIRKQILDYQES